MLGKCVDHRMDCGKAICLEGLSLCSCSALTNISWCFSPVSIYIDIPVQYIMGKTTWTAGLAVLCASRHVVVSDVLVGYPLVGVMS